MPWIDNGYITRVPRDADQTLATFEEVVPVEGPKMKLAALAAHAATAVRVRITRSMKFHTLRSHLREPVVSFTFDDFPRSSLLNAGHILREAGWNGTYYAAGGFCGRRVRGIDYFNREDLIHAHQGGHEIGCHTFRHLNIRRVAAKVILEDLRHNADFVREILPGYELRSFAYPYGDPNIPTKALLAREFPSCRGISEGINQGRIDLAQLRGVGLECRSLDERQTEMWLDRVTAAKGWLVFFTHDVSDDPSEFGCPSSAFARIVASVARRRIKVMTICNAVAFATAPLSPSQKDHSQGQNEHLTGLTTSVSG